MRITGLGPICGCARRRNIFAWVKCPRTQSQPADSADSAAALEGYNLLILMNARKIATVTRNVKKPVRSSFRNPHCADAAGGRGSGTISSVAADGITATA